MVFFSFAKYTNMQKSCPMSPERSSNYIPPHTFYPSTTDISAISATFYMSEERSWDFQSSWSIGAPHINTYSQTHFQWCIDALATHSGRTVGGVRFLDLPAELSLSHPWCQRHTGQPHPCYQGGHEEQVWLALLVNFTFFFTNFDLCSDTSEVALEDNKISGKLFFVGNPLN